MIGVHLAVPPWLLSAQQAPGTAVLGHSPPNGHLGVTFRDSRLVQFGAFSGFCVAVVDEGAESRLFALSNGFRWLIRSLGREGEGTRRASLPPSPRLPALCCTAHAARQQVRSRHSTLYRERAGVDIPSDRSGAHGPICKAVSAPIPQRRRLERTVDGSSLRQRCAGEVCPVPCPSPPRPLQVRRLGRGPRIRPACPAVRRPYGVSVSRCRCGWSSPRTTRTWLWPST